MTEVAERFDQSRRYLATSLENEWRRDSLRFARILFRCETMSDPDVRAYGLERGERLFLHTLVDE